jgi:uncharacterized protein (DUF2225 family)
MITILPPGHPRYDAVAPESNNAFLSAKRVSCPCCYKEFNDANLLSSKLKMKETKDDMRTIHEGIETLWYAVRVCPHCNIASLTQMYGKLSGRDAKLAKLSGYVEKVPKFCGFSTPRKLNEVLEAYYTALYCVKHTDKNPMSSAQLWRRLMWLYDDIGDETLQNIALENCIARYEETYVTRHLTSSEAFHLSIVLGDLCARKGDRSSAYKYFYEAIHGEDKSNAALVRHAQDMITEMRRGGTVE